MNIKNSALVAIGLVIAVGLFVTLKPKDLSAPENGNPKIAGKYFEIVVNNKKVSSGPTVLSVNEGDSVVIKITVDTADELHLHGYDKSIDLEKDTPVELSFIANLTGRFEYELEKSKTNIGVLEVTPR